MRQDNLAIEVVEVNTLQLLAQLKNLFCYCLPSFKNYYTYYSKT